MEIRKLNPDITVSGMACPMWVPLVENNEYNSPGADYFVKKRIDGILQLDPLIDTLILGCTHYPFCFRKSSSSLPRASIWCRRGSMWLKAWPTTWCVTPKWSSSAPEADNAAT